MSVVVVPACSNPEPRGGAGSSFSGGDGGSDAGAGEATSAAPPPPPGGGARPGRASPDPGCGAPCVLVASASRPVPRKASRAARAALEVLHESGFCRAVPVRGGAPATS